MTALPPDYIVDRRNLRRKLSIAHLPAIFHKPFEPLIGVDDERIQRLFCRFARRLVTARCGFQR